MPGTVHFPFLILTTEICPFTRAAWKRTLSPAFTPLSTDGSGVRKTIVIGSIPRFGIAWWSMVILPAAVSTFSTVPETVGRSAAGAGEAGAAAGGAAAVGAAWAGAACAAAAGRFG